MNELEISYIFSNCFDGIVMKIPLDIRKIILEIRMNIWIQQAMLQIKGKMGRHETVRIFDPSSHALIWLLDYLWILSNKRKCFYLGIIVQNLHRAWTRFRHLNCSRWPIMNCLIFNKSYLVFFCGKTLVYCSCSLTGF